MTEQTTKIVNKKQFLALLKDASNKKTKVASINGEIGERIKSAVDDGHLNRQLFGLMLKLSRMDELKRNDFLAQFPIYVEMCREGGVFGDEHAGDLLSQPQEQSQEEADAEAAATNAAAIERGITELQDEDEKPSSYTLQ